MPILQLDILPQPDDETCGATCLHSIYRYYGETIDLMSLISEVPRWETGGTIAVMLACHALNKGYSVTIYSYNLHVFDPSWFREHVDLSAKIKEQLKYKPDPKIQWASQAYLKFLEFGGKIKFEELNLALIRKYLDRKIPLLTGLNATYLYRCARELNNEYDDLRGTSMGHFVVLTAYDKDKDKILIADPLVTNPFSNQRYHVSVDRVINSIMLGILTYDANLVVIEKHKETKDGDFNGSK